MEIPDKLNAQMPYYEVDSGHAYFPNEDDKFHTDGPGWALLKYRTGPTPGQDWVGFEVVRAVNHTDTDFEFVLTPKEWDIGTEITDPYHQTGDAPANRPGYIYDPERDDRYAPGIYGDTGQIFAVNEDVLEVWWYNLSRTEDPGGPEWPRWPADARVQWPSKVMRYQAQWPDSPEEIVIARQNGSGVIDESQYGTDWEIYHHDDDQQPGFNPNDEHALKKSYAEGEAIFALRDDLAREATSDAYVLMKYKDQPENDRFRFRVFKVVRENERYAFKDWPHLSRDPGDPNHDPPQDPYEAKAGVLIQAPYPLSTLQYCVETEAVSGPYLEDRKSNHWAKAAGDDGGTAEITMRYFYPVQPGFYFPSDVPQPEEGKCVPWLDDGTGTPVDVVLTAFWPDNIPKMRIGETLIESMRQLPAIKGQQSVDVVYQQSIENGGGPSVALIDPIQTHAVELAEVPSDIDTGRQGAEEVFTDLSLALRRRVSYDPVNLKLKFKGDHVDPTTGFEYAILNVMSEREQDELLALSANAVWQGAVNALYNAAKEPVVIADSAKDPYDMLALTTGFAQGTGYVTLAMQNADNPDKVNPALPVSLEIIEVIDELDPGAISVITPQCPFDETLTLRHRGDFGGRTDEYVFEWRLVPDLDGAPELPAEDWQNWEKFATKPEGGAGAVDITIEGPGLPTLRDNRVIARYKYTGNAVFAGGDDWSEWTEPQLAEGWIKRIMGDIDPFQQRATGGGIEGAENKFFSYAEQEVNTMVSMISQAGRAWEGNVPLNCSGLDNYGLLEIYETVLGHGKDLSIDGNPPVNYGPANQALLLAAGRIADLYMLLGNEAYADAADPTIAFGTDGDYGAEAASIHAFMNQTRSLLEEELALLRGRDDIAKSPLYNRLTWNFTRDIAGGEVAYALNYNIQDQDGDAAGKISEADAEALYPQGHGDAWGRYLSAIKSYYQLLEDSNYTWQPRSESVLVAGEPVLVDYLDERKFATAAAAKARAGAEIVNLTYRSKYVEDPARQWQGYKDADPERAWGLAEWASRAGQGAYLDWVVDNAILPHEDTEHTGIQKIDRTTVPELREVASRFGEIQAQLDTADVGLNPLGLATNVVPFDIDPDKITEQKQTHFEQIYDRAVTALNNAIAVFNHANNSTQRLRRQADTLAEFKRTVEDREADFKSRLIEIFGYPYDADIGPGKTYPTGYDGPDLYHYTYVDPSELTGEKPPPVIEVPLTVTGSAVQDDGSLETTEQEVVFHFSASADRFGLVKPQTWGTSARRAPGEIQMARSDLIQARARFERALVEYDNLIARIQDQAELLQAQHNLNAEEINVLNEDLRRQQRLNSLIKQSRSRQLDFRTRARTATIVANAVAEALPTSAGFSVDATSAARSAIRLAGTAKTENFTRDADRESLVELDHQQAAQAMQAQSRIRLTSLRTKQVIQQQIKQLEQTVRQEHSLRLELYTLQEALQQTSGRYMATLARGQRLLDDRIRFRRQTAADVQSRRYKDMAFRIFRDDALQKYRAQYDLAARYVYLAAKAYDFETNLLSNDPEAGEAFLTDIVRARSIGTIQNRLPQTGEGLADPMAQMSRNFDVLKGQMGFNNPQKETNRFSLRWELFRIPNTIEDNAVWRETLRRHVVPNLLDVPEFQRYARVFQPHLTAEPGIVIPFETTVTAGLNFFGRVLSGDDHSYNSSNYTTKVRSVGVWFDNYDTTSAAGLSNTPHVYLIPVGSDIQRSSTSNSGQIRAFKVLDQVLPVPFPIGSDRENPDWIPSEKTLQGTFIDVRRYPSFRAYQDSGQFNATEVIRNSRLIGRSVWNTRWLLIIPAVELLGDREEGLNRFIDGALEGDQRNGEGVSDIKIFFETYAYPGQ